MHHPAPPPPPAPPARLHASTLACPASCLPLQDESNPDFVSEVVELYFEDSAVKIDTLAQKLVEPVVNYGQVGGWVGGWEGGRVGVGRARCVPLSGMRAS